MCDELHKVLVQPVPDDPDAIEARRERIILAYNEAMAIMNLTDLPIKKRPLPPKEVSPCEE